MRHQDSLILSGREYQRLVDSKFLIRRNHTCYSIKLDGRTMYRLVASWSEATWEQVCDIIEGRQE